MDLKVTDFQEGYFKDILYRIAQIKGYDTSRGELSINLDEEGYIRGKIYKSMPEDCIAYFYDYNLYRVLYITYNEYIEYKMRWILD